VGDRIHGLPTHRGSDVALGIYVDMKYMGSKRWMLKNGLGDLIAREVCGATRFVDLFAGSSAVGAHVAMKYEVRVVAYDLQTFSVILAQSVLGRTEKLDADVLWQSWYGRARDLRRPLRPPSARVVTRASVKTHREWCSTQAWPVTKAYGGHYFCALQAVWLDALRQTLPENEPEKTVALAALVHAASKCAAAPGHTAQPFQPTKTAKRFLQEAWQKDIVGHCKRALAELSQQHAKVVGDSSVADANEAAKSITEGDLVFIDPPYSGVHYSRFYHLLETLTRGIAVPCREPDAIRSPVIGRAPSTVFAPNHRPPWMTSSVLFPLAPETPS
jgi:adenine-specific DNA-methyltransferase